MHWFWLCWVFVAEHGLPLAAGYELLIGLASLVAEYGLQGGLRSYGAQAWLLLDMWDLPGSGVKPMSPALAGGFFTTELPGTKTILLSTYSWGHFT